MDLDQPELWHLAETNELACFCRWLSAAGLQLRAQFAPFHCANQNDILISGALAGSLRFGKLAALGRPSSSGLVEPDREQLSA